MYIITFTGNIMQKKPSELALGKDRGPGENALGDVKFRVNGVGETENKSVSHLNTLYLFWVHFFICKRQVKKVYMKKLTFVILLSFS